MGAEVNPQDREETGRGGSALNATGRHQGGCVVEPVRVHCSLQTVARPPAFTSEWRHNEGEKQSTTALLSAMLLRLKLGYLRCRLTHFNDNK